MSTEQPNEAPRVIYVSRPGPLTRTRENIRRSTDAWIKAAIDAPLPPRLHKHIPASLNTPGGRMLLAVCALLALLLWAVALVSLAFR